MSPPDGLVLKMLRPGPDLDALKDDVWRVLEATNEDFYPPLSSRPPGRGRSPAGGIALWDAPVVYFKDVMNECVVLSYLDEDVVGLLTFTARFSTERLAGFVPCTYISTVAVMPRARRRGIAHAMYEQVLALPEDLHSPFVGMRTWSKNESNIRLAVSLGFKEVRRVVNDRAPGVDSIYLARPAPPPSSRGASAWTEP